MNAREKRVIEGLIAERDAARAEALALRRDGEYLHRDNERLRGAVREAWLRAEKRGYQELIDILEPALDDEG